MPPLTEELALLLGMFAGDGCLPVSHNGDGNRIYPIRFYNTDKGYVDLFARLFFKVFSVQGKLRGRKRQGKKMLWEFEKYAVDIYLLLNGKLGIACGKKALQIGIPHYILTGSDGLRKHFFLGLLLTDGSYRAKGDMLFHMASEDIMYGLQALIFLVWGFIRPVRAYVQENKYVSYQIVLNKEQSSCILKSMPSSHNLVLRRSP